MPIDAIQDALPAYAKDLSLSLAALTAEPVLSPQQLWGACLASAHAVGAPVPVRAFAAVAREAGLSEAALTAARAAAAVMAMNNVYFRALHLMENAEYRALPSRLRGNFAASPGVEKTDFELWCLTVSAINGCGACLDAHEAELKARGVSATAIQSALRLGAVVSAVCRVMAAGAL